MRKYQKKINECGLAGKKLSKTLTSLINNFIASENELEGLEERKKELEASELDEDKEQISVVDAEINELKAILNGADNELVEAIQKYATMLPAYLKKSEEMRAKKVAGANNPPAPPESKEPADPVVPVEGRQDGIPEPAIPNPAPAPEPSPQPAPAPIAEKNEKKKSDGVWWLVAGLIAAVTVGTVILRKRD